MKIKGFRKYLSGGAIPPIFVDYTPVIVNNSVPDPMLNYLAGISSGTAASTKRSSSSSSGNDGMPSMKDTLALLKDMKGLDNDTLLALHTLQQAQIEASQMSVFGGNEQSSLILQYYRNLELVNKVARSKEEFEDAYKQAKDLDSLNEAAITSDGKVVVLKDNVLSFVTPSEYLRNKGSYVLQTNLDLLYRRQHDSGMAFLNGVLNIVLNSTSFKQIHEAINDIAGKLGKSSLTIEGYTTKELGLIALGIAVLKEASQKYKEGMPMDGVYKTTLKNETQLVLAELAVDAIYRSLNDTQKTWLKLHGNGTEKGARAMIREMVIANTSDVNEFKVDYQQDLNPDGSSKSKKSKSSGSDINSGIKNDEATNFFLGHGNREKFTIKNEGMLGIDVNAVSIPLLVGNNQNTTIATLELVGSGRLGGLMLWTNATMGSARVDPDRLSKVIVTGKVYSAEMPIDVAAYNSPEAIIRPDLELTNKMEEVNKTLGELGQKTEHLTLQEIATINKAYSDAGLPVKYNSEGKLTTAYRRFALMNATAAESAFLGDVTFNNGAQEVDGDEKRAYVDNMRRLTGNDKYDTDRAWYGLGLGLWGLEDVYKGIVYIPVSDNIFDALAGSNYSLTPEQSMKIDELQQQADYARRLGYKNPGSWSN